jgi:hypothetical protein
MARGRVGALSRSTYFPGTGDQLSDTNNGITWLCVRSNTFVDESGTSVNYGLLKGVSPELDAPNWRPIGDADKSWLDGVDTIQRPLAKDEQVFRTYAWSDETGTWRQVRK